MRTPRESRGRRWRALAVYAAFAAAAFWVGTSGWPGRAATSVVGWLSEAGTQFDGPVGEAVRSTFSPESPDAR
jgi:hypothetical protein